MAKANLDIILGARDDASAKLLGVGRNAGRLDSTLRTLGGGLAAYFSGRAIASGLVDATKLSEEFRQQIAKVDTMLDASTEGYLPAYREAIAQLALDFGDSTDTLSDGLYNVLSASVPAANAIVYLRDSTKAAVAGITNTAVAVDGATSLMNAFHVEASRSAEVFDLMFTAVKRGKLNFEQLASNIGKVAPAANAANMSMGDTLALIASLTRQGFSVEEATTRIVALLKKFPNAGRDMAGMLQGYAGQDLAQIQESVPDVKAAQAVAALSSDLKGLRGDMDAMRGSAGALDEAYAKMADTKRFARLNQAWIAMKRNMGDMITQSETFGAVIDWLVEKLPKIPAYYDLIEDKIALAMLGAVEESKWAWHAIVESATWAWDTIKAGGTAYVASSKLSWVVQWEAAKHFFTVQLPTVAKYFYGNWGDIAKRSAEQISKLFTAVFHNIRVAYENFQRELSFSLAEIMIDYNPLLSAEEQASALESLRENRNAERNRAGSYQDMTFDLGGIFQGLNVPERVKGAMEKQLESEAAAAMVELLATFGRLLDIPNRELTDAERAIRDRIIAKQAAIAAGPAAPGGGAGKPSPAAEAAAAAAGIGGVGIDMAATVRRFASYVGGRQTTSDVIRAENEKNRNVANETNSLLKDAPKQIGDAVGAAIDQRLVMLSA